MTTKMLYPAALLALAALAVPAGTQAATKPAPKKPAAAKKAPAKKPAPPKKAAPAKAPAQAAGPIVLGTKQLPGNFGTFGTTYTIGTNTPINFTLRDAEYRADRFRIGDSDWGLSAEEKVLVLHYTVHNPRPEEQYLNWDSLTFTAVDSQDTNHEYIQSIVRSGTNKESLSMALKPAQKVDVTTAIVVPAEGVVPKLIVQREPDAAVIRYDLRGKVKPIEAPFADPADTSGATPRRQVPAAMGTLYPLGHFDVRLDSVQFATGPLADQEPEEGNRFLTAIFTVRNDANVARYVNWDTFEPTLRDADGEKVEYNQHMLKATRNEEASGELEPGEEIRIRYFFELPKDTGGKSLLLVQGESRALVFDVSSAS